MSFSKQYTENNNEKYTKNSFFSFPSPLEENHFSRTLGASLPSQNPSSFQPNDLSLTSNQQIPILPLQPTFAPPYFSAIETTVNCQNSGCFNLMSCTEGLGFESSDNIIPSSFDNLGNSNNEKGNNLPPLMTCSTSYCLRKNLEEKDFPPPLTSSNFVLTSVREDGRLRIFGILIKRPEILCASRDNGRLKLNLVQDITSSDDDDDEYIDDEVEIFEDREKDEKWKINLQQRCLERDMHVWSPQRCVTIA